MCFERFASIFTSRNIRLLLAILKTKRRIQKDSDIIEKKRKQIHPIINTEHRLKTSAKADNKNIIGVHKIKHKQQREQMPLKRNKLDKYFIISGSDF